MASKTSDVFAASDVLDVVAVAFDFGFDLRVQVLEGTGTKLRPYFYFREESINRELGRGRSCLHAGY